MEKSEKGKTRKVYTPEEKAELRKKKWNELTYDEKRALLPKKLNKVGEWLLSDEEEGYFTIVDMDAVLQ